MGIGAASMRATRQCRRRVCGQNPLLDRIAGRLEQTARGLDHTGTITGHLRYVLDDRHPRTRGDRERRDRQVEGVPHVVPPRLIVQIGVSLARWSSDDQVDAPCSRCQSRLHDLRFVHERSVGTPTAQTKVDQRGHRCDSADTRVMVRCVDVGRFLVFVDDQLRAHGQSDLRAQIPRSKRETSGSAEQIHRPERPGALRGGPRHRPASQGRPPSALQVRHRLGCTDVDLRGDRPPCEPQRVYQPGRLPTVLFRRDERFSL